MEFVNLHAHTSLGSMLDALVSVDELFDRVAEMGQKAVAITDHGTLSSHYDGFKAHKRTGIKFIPGCEGYFVHSFEPFEVVVNGRKRMKNEVRKHILMLAQNARGYKNLLKSNYEAFKMNEVSMGHVYPRLGWDILEEHAEGIICTSACGGGILAERLMLGDYDGARKMAERLGAMFKGRFFLEIQPHHLKVERVDQELINDGLVRLARDLKLPLVASSDSHYLTKASEPYHDMLLAIRSKKALADDRRLSYGIDEFYIKSGEEIHAFLSKHYGSDVADEAVENTVRIAEMCDDPDYLAPSGHHLPTFSVKDEADYEEFLDWRKQNKGAADLDEDAAFMRFRCFKGFCERFSGMPEVELKKRWKRVRYEVEILERNKFSSYMMVVSDYIRWAKQNDILVGVGRGCLEGSTLVLTDRGLVELKKIRKGDNVFSHTGKLRRVLDTFRYEVNEELVRVKTDFAFVSSALTQDHKVYGCRGFLTEKGRQFQEHGTYSKSAHWGAFGRPEWIEAGKLRRGDGIFVPWPEKPQRCFPEVFDMSVWAHEHAEILNDSLQYRTASKVDELSIRSVAKEVRCCRRALRKIKEGKISTVNKIGRRSGNAVALLRRLTVFLGEKGMTLREWQAYESGSVKSIRRFLPLDEDMAYFIGRWIGDGWVRFVKESGGYQVGLAFFGDDKEGLERVRGILSSWGFSGAVYNHCEKNLKQIVLYDKILYGFLKHVVSGYRGSPQTKHFPRWFRSLPDVILKSLLRGLVQSDGSVEKTRFCVDTTSFRLAGELREAALYLRLMSSVVVRKKRFDERLGSWCSESYKVRFYPQQLEHTCAGIRGRASRIRTDGFYVRVQDISYKRVLEVYDIKVEKDCSYITSEYAVHNSVGGSLVGYLLDIHGVDPFEYGLLFERFQNAEKTSLPDIDTDFAGAGRDRVQEYVRRKYGHDHCAQVSNFLTYTPKNVVDDVARSLRLGDKKTPGEPNDKSKNYFMIAKMIKDSIPADASTINEALEKSPKFREFEKKYPELMDYAKALLGKEKGYATHAAGMVVSDVPIVEFAPLRVDKHGMTALQYEKDRCEDIGLVKMDFLGLTTLDVIAEALKNIKRLGEDGPENMEDIPLDDAATYEMISRGLTRCVFQLGKTGMMAALCKRIQPRNIFDIAIVNALGRPSSGERTLEDGTKYSERTEYIARRNGEKPVTYLHPSLKCLEETKGLCIMEEQLMAVAGNVAGWDLNKADGLRKFTKLKKKGADLAVKLKKDFIQGVIDTHGVDLEFATRVWTEVIEKFGGYGFNRSHAVFYSINGYYTAYLKRHHPAAFLAAELKIATMKNSITSDDEVYSAKQECRRLGIKILPPDVNRSSMGYEVLDQETIVMGLAAIKGLGDKGVKEIVDCQPFESFIDFLHRVNARVVNKSKVAALAKAGCFECFRVSRKFAHDEGKSVRDKLKRFLTKREKDGYDVTSAIADFPFSPSGDEWDKKELLTHEREVLGECLSGSLNDMYDNFFKGHPPVTQLDRIKMMPDRAHLVVEVLVKTAIREFTIKKQGRNFGKKMIKYNVEDINGIATELTVWPAQYALAKKLLKDGTPIRAHCQVSDFNGQKTLMLMSFQSVYGVSNGSPS